MYFNRPCLIVQFSQILFLLAVERRPCAFQVGFVLEVVLHNCNKCRSVDEFVLLRVLLPLVELLHRCFVVQRELLV